MARPVIGARLRPTLPLRKALERLALCCHMDEGGRKSRRAGFSVDGNERR
jgi:hypothetical protein